ncbi:hypothetical protein BSLG_000405 [Batrachochytrium salamandrivorans]|nr:hypothetical protein BSLG_000405 [Batrachochytrium salamandrivorans]
MGSKAERFKSPLAATGFIGPGSYEINQSSCMQAKVMTKPTSVLGVCLNRAIRFPEIKVNENTIVKHSSTSSMRDVPVHVHHSVVARLKIFYATKWKIKRAQLALGQVSLFLTLPLVPSPMPLSISALAHSTSPIFAGSYDANYAIGRNVSNDHSFAMLKSNQLKKRQLGNSMQIDKLRRLVEKDDIFTDKLACRRMAYLSLYYD